jgi:hypothetical protein
VQGENRRNGPLRINSVDSQLAERYKVSRTPVRGATPLRKGLLCRFAQVGRGLLCSFSTVGPRQCLADEIAAPYRSTRTTSRILPEYDYAEVAC